MTDESHDRLVKDTNAPLLGKTFASTMYPEPYVEEIFYIWYKLGKPKAMTLRGRIEPTLDGVIPPESALKVWINEIFKKKAEELDTIVREQVENQAVTEKVEMLNRHADVGHKMQTMAIEYLESHKDDLKTNVAVRMLVDGIRIERESRGLPSLITEALDSTDEALFKKVSALMDKLGDDFPELEAELDDEE